MSSSSILPPLDGSLNVSEIIDVHFANSTSVAFSYTDADGHVTSISHLELARAAHRAAHLLRPQRCGPEGQVVAIVAVTDVLVYQTLAAGCIRAGLIPFPISHRNSEAALFRLLNTTNSHRLLTTRGSLSRVVDSLAAEVGAQSPAYELSIEEIPLLGQLYPHLGHETVDDAFVPYPGPVVSTPLDTIVMYLHSSGSTGFPKSIPITHRNMIHFSALGLPQDTLRISPRQAVGALPAFHTMGMVMQFVPTLVLGGTVCIYPPASVSAPMEYRIPPNTTPENALENARAARATGIMTVPAFLIEWAGREEDVAYLKTLKLVAFGGGPLATRVGDFLVSQGVKLVSFYGATEFGITGQSDLDHGEHWTWMKMSDRTNVRWVPVGDGTFECQVLTTPTHQVAVENLPDVKGYSTKDLFERHPTKPDLYRIVGRLDDVLIMANGEKAVPGPMEDVMMASPFVAGAVMFGRERNQVGVLIEPNREHAVRDEKELAEYRNMIWGVIEDANENAPAFARIYKEMILVTEPSRPMVRTPKGTVIKKATVALYRDDIEKLYTTIEASGNGVGDIEPPVSWTAEALEPWLASHATLLSSKTIRCGVDLFDQGFDSLNATFLRHRIVGTLRNSGDENLKAVAGKIPQNFVYGFPEIGQLARALMKLVHGGDASAASDREEKKKTIEAIIAKYSEGFDQPISSNRLASRSGGAVVLLTGSTGGLGSHILEILLGLDMVERVYAYNRKSRTPVAQRQREGFVDRALNIELLSSKKLVYLEGDSATADLGLPEDVYTMLRDSLTVIIHNAWMLDFNKSLSTFEPHIKGTRNLIDLARQSPNAAGIRFLFTSSVGSAQGWDLGRGPFPEELQLDAGVAVGNGYGEGKYASERILAASGLHATSFRIGQVSGSSSNGSWATSHWVPAIVKSSIALGNFPADPAGTVAWLPPEAVSHTIIDVALSEQPLPFAINLVHPRSVRWDVVMSSMARAVGLPLVPFREWVQQLEGRASNATSEDLEQIPGHKLLDFFRRILEGTGNIQFSTDKAQAASDSMRLLSPLSEEDTKRWMSYWKDVGYIH